MKTTAVAIVAADAGARTSLANLLNSTGSLRCVGGYANVRSALAGIPGMKPDVVLLDTKPRCRSGAKLTRQLKAMLPELPVLLLIGDAQDNSVLAALRAGAHGCVLKTRTCSDVPEKIREVCNGGVPLPARVARRLLDFWCEASRDSASADMLTAREREIMDHLCRGLQNKEIADSLNISVLTAHRHLHNIYRKLGINNRVEAVNRFRQT